MAKKQLKKLNQPKKYLQGGSNMASVAQTRQNPYYIGQVNADAAEDQFQSTQDQLVQARLDAAQAQKDARESSNQQLDATVRNNTSNLVKAAATDQKNGNLGKFFTKAPKTIGNTNPFAFMQAPAQSIGTGTAIEGVGVLAPQYMPAAQAGLGTAADAGVGVLAPEFIAPAADAGNIVTSAGSTATGLSSLATAGIGAAGTIGGQLIKRGTNDNSAYTFTDRERRGNVGGSALSSAGTVTPFALNPAVLAATSGFSALAIPLAAGYGALKARKENKASQEEADRLQREQAALRGAYQSASINSSSTGADTGFGLNSSTNMNNNFTNQFQVARTGGVTGIQEDRRTKKVPGGKIVPIEGTDAVEFVGRTHAQGGILIDKNTEVEGGGKNGQGETMDQVAMSNNNKQDYIFSKYLKLGGKSFAQRHKEILKGSGSQADIQQLAAMQEKVAGRNPQQVAAYGGFHKYIDGGVKPCPECPPGTICDVATGACVPDEDSGSGNSYDWNATGMEGFKAKQNAAAPAPAATVKQEPEKPAEPILYYNDKNKKYTYRDEKGKKLMSGYDQNRLSNQMNAQRPGATGFDQQLADIEKRETPGVNPPADNQTVIAQQNSTSNAPAKTPFENTPTKLPIKPTKTFGQQKLEEAMAKSELNDKIQEGKQILNTVTDVASLDAAYDANKITLGEYNAKRKELEAAAPKPSPTATVNPGVQLPANTQTVTTTTNPSANTTTTATTKEKGWGAAGAPSSQIDRDQDPTVDPTGKKLPDGYVWDATLNAVVSATGANAAASASANKTGTATYNPAPGVSPQSGSTNPPIVTTTGTSTDPTVTYVNSNDPNAPAPAPQTPEEIEAARLAGLPRMFMGASRKVDEATGNVTIDKGKPLMGAGSMADSRLGTTDNSAESLGKVTNNAYDQAWNNKADNLYTNQVDAGSGGLSFSNYVTDRDKIAGSNWGKKYGYTVGMSEADAKAAHGKFEADVHSLFKNNPDEMMGYFQYIIDGGDPNTKEDAKNKKPGTYLGKDAEQIRTNLKNKGFIGADGKVIAGKEKAMQKYLEEQATDNFVGPIHNALGSYTAERGGDKIKLEKEKEKKRTEITQEIPKKFEPCPPGTYRSGDGTCKELGDIPQGNRISGTMLAGLGQLIPVGAALANPYKIAPGIVGAPGIKGALMPRVNLNQERASAIQQNVAYKNAVLGQNAGPASLVAMQSANTKTNQQMLTIAQQEQDSNRQLASEEAKLGMQASMFNADTDQKRQMFNAEFNQGERRYRREDILGALDTGAARIAGIVKDDRAYKSDERLARALDETGAYDRFTILEQLNKEAKRKNSPYANTTEAERRRMAAAMHKELNPEGYVGKSEYTKLQEEKDKLQKEKDEAEKKNQAKFGGARQYVSRLGQLSGVRATKAKL